MIAGAIAASGVVAVLTTFTLNTGEEVTGFVVTCYETQLEMVDLDRKECRGWRWLSYCDIRQIRHADMCMCPSCSHAKYEKQQQERMTDLITECEALRTKMGVNT